MSLIRAAWLAIGIAIGVLPSARGFAQANAEDMAEKEWALVEVLTEALPISRLPEIYADLRQAMREVYLPALRDTVKGDAPGGRALKDEERDSLVKIEKLFDYSLRASDELEPFLQENREPILHDIARLQTGHMTLAEVNALREALDLPATRKVFNAIYAGSRLLTAYSYADMRSYYAQSAWLNQLALDLQNTPSARPDAPPPSAEKIAKAQAVLADLMRVSRLDDMVAEMVRFVREVIVPASGKTADAADPLGMLDGAMTFYNLNKPILLATGSSILAVALTDEQLEQLHLLVLSPVMAKSFGLLYDAVRAVTSFTSQDVQSLQHFAEMSEKNGLFAKRSAEEEAQLKQETEALAEVWRERAWNRLTPETRAGLEAAIKDIEAMEQKQFSPGTGGDDNDDSDGIDDLLPGIQRL
jgi:hypothetical protein